MIHKDIIVENEANIVWILKLVILNLFIQKLKLVLMKLRHYFLKSYDSQFHSEGIVHIGGIQS